jgi:serine/threonine-protein kinase RsbW
MDSKNLTFSETKSQIGSIKGNCLKEMIKTIKINSSLENMNVVENTIDRITNEYGVTQENYGKILVSTMEAVNNAIVHGNKSDISKFVQIIISLENKNLFITVEDEGSGFKPAEIPDPTKPENIESINGRGIFLMSKLADEIIFNRKGNKVKMKFKL